MIDSPTCSTFGFAGEGIGKVLARQAASGHARFHDRRMIADAPGKPGKHTKNRHLSKRSLVSNYPSVTGDFFSRAGEFSTTKRRRRCFGASDGRENQKRPPRGSSPISERSQEDSREFDIEAIRLSHILNPAGTLLHCPFCLRRWPPASRC